MKNHDNTVQAVGCASVWLFNPLTVTVSTRGNAESLIAVLVLLMLLLLAHDGPYGILFSAVAYGLSVHMKIYPVTYALSLYLHINRQHVTNKLEDNVNCGCAWFRHFRCMWPTSSSVMFVLASLLTFLLATIICYNWWVVTVFRYTMHVIWVFSPNYWHSILMNH